MDMVNYGKLCQSLDINIYITKAVGLAQWVFVYVTEGTGRSQTDTSGSSTE